MISVIGYIREKKDGLQTMIEENNRQIEKARGVLAGLQTQQVRYGTEMKEIDDAIAALTNARNRVTTAATVSG
ncbi:MAG: hypothetical protein HGJ93_00650 [Desulfosarcina sp.]|nr:hypothetical protein [Desulfosarcina sp.]MBC2764495.1 hypothetical protein [Desulfosarcina sp.]